MKSETYIKTSEMILKDTPIDFNKEVKAVVVGFRDREVIVENDNFGTRRRYPSFEKGKEKADLHPSQIVWAGLTLAAIVGDTYINKDGKRKKFKTKMGE